MDTFRLVAVMVGLVLVVGAGLWPHPDRGDLARIGVLLGQVDAGSRLVAGQKEIITLRNQELDAKERELIALRETVALYKAEDERRSTLTWNTGLSVAMMTVRDQQVRYTLKGQDTDRETFYRAIPGILDAQLLESAKRLKGPPHD